MMKISAKRLHLQDHQVLKEIIGKQWHLGEYFPSYRDQQAIQDHIWDYLLQRHAKTTYIYDDGKLVGAAFYGNHTKHYHPLPEDVNQNFKYLFCIRAAFEEHILANGQKQGMVFFFYAKTDVARELLVREIQNYVFKSQLRSLFFCSLDVSEPLGKIVEQLNFPINNTAKLPVTWGASYFNPKQSDLDIEFGIYGQMIGTEYIYRESFPCTTNPQCPTTILLIHGMATDHKTWKGMIPILQKFANVETIDLPLHGRSNIFPLNEIHWDLSVMGLYIAKFVREQNFQDLIVWGHSLGGGVAMLLWLYCQDIIRGLILEDPYNPGALKTRSGFFYGLVRAIKNQIGYVRWKNEKSSAPIIQNIQVNDQTNDVLAVYRPLTREIFTFFSNLLDENERIISDFAYHQNQKLPTLVMAGANDYVINNKLSEAYFESLTKNYTFILVPFANHSPHMNNPVFTEAQVVSYLSHIMK